MPLQDLTPQLRTRLNRMERVVGWFVLIATALMLFGFGYFIYRTAERRGWFETKAPYFTSSDSGAGLNVGDPVYLMGFEVGRITRIFAMPPRGEGSNYNVKIEFEIVGTNYSYVWTGDSRARFTDSGFLGKRVLDVTKGKKGYGTYINFPVRQMSVSEIPSSSHLAKLRLGQDILKPGETNYLQQTNLALTAWSPLATNLDKIAELGVSNVWTIDTTERSKEITAIWKSSELHYAPFDQTNSYFLPPDQSPALMDRVNGVVAQIELALPNFLALTNQLAATLANAVKLTSNLNEVSASVRPTISNLDAITANLRDPHGSLGEWILPTNINQQLALTLLNANGAVTNVNLTLTNVNTNLVAVFEEVTSNLENLAGITSNLNHQVQVNSNMLSSLSDIIVHSDQFIQGLKHHWLLRSAFKTTNTNAPPKSRSSFGAPNTRK